MEKHEKYVIMNFPLTLLLQYYIHMYTYVFHACLVTYLDITYTR